MKKKERIKLFLLEYYFGVSSLYKIFRLVGGPVLLLFGFNLYSEASDRFGIGYGGFMIVFAIYYTLKPFLWIISKHDSFKNIQFEIGLIPDKLIIKEDKSRSEIELSKLHKVLKRKTYYVIAVQKGMKIYLPLNQLSSQLINTLNQHISN